MQEVALEADEEIFRRGEEADGMLLVASGRLRLEREPGGLAGTVGPGAVLGALSLVVAGPREADVFADVASRVFWLPRSAYRRLSEDTPRAACRFMEHVLGDLTCLIRPGLDAVPAAPPLTLRASRSSLLLSTDRTCLTTTVGRLSPVMTEIHIREGLTFDDVLLQPGASTVLPRDVDLRTALTREIQLNIPLVSAAMDTVTEHATAICMAQHGGIGMVHRNMPPAAQAAEVDKVKRSESGMIVDPDHDGAGAAASTKPWR